jgi:hypothetical protein
MIPLLYSRVGKGTSSLKVGTSGGRGGKLYNFASLWMDDGVGGVKEPSLLSVSLLE